MISAWGANGRLVADRQECQLYLREAGMMQAGMRAGWSVRYTTELTDEVWYYLRGEEYSAQIDYFAQSMKARRLDGENTFASALEADRVAALIGAQRTAGRTRDPRPSQPKSRWARIFS